MKQLLPNMRNLFCGGNFNTNINKSFALAALLVLFISGETYALTGSPYMHDPSAIVKSGSKYYIFSTGGGINVSSSTDLIKWTSEKPVFSSIPGWVKTYVANFNGNYWAPSCAFMNGKYYLYYTCAEWGTPNCTIGVATNPTLDQSASNYKWTDLGMVVYANSNRHIDAIDPSVFIDTNNRAYLSYGGYVGGNAVGEIDLATGKLKNGFTKIASKGEGTAIIKEGNYYYFIEQHGSCCSGVNSTYYMSCGRSTNPLGPYVDANGTSLITSYGVDVFRKSGKYIGPGHFGLYKENGASFVSYHYYDGNNNGQPTLGIGKLIFENGWPKVTRDWLPNGTYSMSGKASSKAVEIRGCTTSGTPAIIQYNTTGSNCQKWGFAPQGNGVYRITSSLSGSRVLEVAGCGTGNGAKIQLGTWSNAACQKFLVERAGDGSYVLTPTNTGRVIEVPGNSSNADVQLALYDFNGCACQRWVINAASSRNEESLAENDYIESGSLVVYPNPFSDELMINSEGASDYSIYSISGSLIEKGQCSNKTLIGKALPAGSYILKCNVKGEVKRVKILKQ